MNEEMEVVLDEVYASDGGAGDLVPVSEDDVLDYFEAVEVEPPHYAMSTHFDDYTVTEALLLLVFVILLLEFFLNIVRRWF